jgi:putative ABC transport system permease protein
LASLLRVCWIVIPAIHRKLFRDLMRLKGQVLTIALVVAAGIASFVALQGNYSSLELARDAFYERQRFAAVFARLESAPESLRASLEALPGVERVQTRVVEHATLPLPRLSEPVRASLVALPDVDREVLNAIALREGRRPEPDHADEAVQGHMRLDVLRRTLSEEPVVSMALLRTDPPARAELDERLKALPYLAEVSRRSHMLERFEQQSASMIRTVSAIIALFAATITVGVVYNSARIALATRARDLASLRVLGFTRGEISSILLGELGLQVLIALPFGFVFGHWLVEALASSVDPETYRLPIVLTIRSYAFAATVTLLAALFSALIVRRRIDKLDLVAVLKTKE